ncbi:protein containing BRO [Candidatus Magnetobacterium bavaricum]|uniref:Protein containing BRO n=1 Tax=Candidatus Magnetobacterium bavaricum TaxID=29290 RepID=A0A0F3GJ68_9BACT|nr:protein containing BRO [Candidatus Magnetobacterium bavaricum]
MTTQSTNTSLLSPQDIQNVNGEYCLTAKQIAQGLGYPNVDGIHKLYSRHQDELNPYKGSVTSTDPSGGPQEVTVYTEEGIYIICMLARTPKAKEFRKQVAAILKGLRQQQIRELESSVHALTEKVHGLETAQQMTCDGEFLTVQRYGSLAVVNWTNKTQAVFNATAIDFFIEALSLRAPNGRENMTGMVARVGINNAAIALDHNVNLAERFTYLNNEIPVFFIERGKPSQC